MQMEMEDESKEYLTINTHRGLFRYNRLIYGIASAPAIWQRTMEQILQGIDGVKCMIDDMIVTGASDSEHLRNLENVLQRLQCYGLRANVEKCNIFKKKVEFCGHMMDAKGLHKTTEKVRAIVEAKTPENVSELRAFLGLVNYYGISTESSYLTPTTLHASREGPKVDVDSRMRKSIQSRERPHAIRQYTCTLRSKPTVATFVRCLTIRPRGRTLSCVSVGRGETDSV